MFTKLAAIAVNAHDNHHTAYCLSMAAYGVLAGVALTVMNKKLYNIPSN